MVELLSALLFAGEGVAGTATPPHPARASAAISRRSLRRMFMARPSEDLEDRVDRAFRASIRGRDRDEAVQEGVLRCCRLEARRRAEVVRRRIDPLATRESGEDLGRAVTETERRHVDERAVVGGEGEAQIELEDAVAPEERPVAAAREDDAAEARPFEG